MFCWEKVKELYVRRKILRNILGVISLVLVILTLITYLDAPTLFGSSLAIQIWVLMILILFESILPAFASETKAQRAFLECMKDSFSADKKNAMNRVGFYLEITSYYRKIIFGPSRGFAPIQAKWALGVAFKKRLPPFVAIRIKSNQSKSPDSASGSVAFPSLTAVTNIKSYMGAHTMGSVRTSMLKLQKIYEYENYAVYGYAQHAKKLGFAKQLIDVANTLDRMASCRILRILYDSDNSMVGFLIEKMPMDYMFIDSVLNEITNTVEAIEEMME